MDLRIDNEIACLIPPLKAEEFETLQESILEDGCRDPLVVWAETDILLDGHNRYRICIEHEIPYTIQRKSFPDRDSALDWVDRNQLGRRNLTPEQMSLLRGRRYNRLKRQDGGHGDQKSEGQNVPPIPVSEILSKQYGVSSKTIKRDGSFVNDITKLKEIVPDIEQKIVSAKEKITKQEISLAANLVDTYPEAAEAIITKSNHRALGTGENEWYTPHEYIEAARSVMDGIDLDPASSALAQKTVMADKIFTIDDDGLSKPWHGRVWLNPPYTQPDIKNFVVKLIDEISNGNATEGILLTHNYTDTTWFHKAASICDAICFTKGRIAFVNQLGQKAAPTQGQAFFYYGPHLDRFSEVFSRFGLILRR